RIEKGGEVVNNGTASNSGIASATGIGIVAQGPGSSSSEAVDGPGSKWSLNGGLGIGEDGGNGSLSITGGGRVTAASATVGSYFGGSAGTGDVDVDGAGSWWSISGDLSIGQGGVGMLSITSGASVSAATASIGSDFVASTGTGDVNVKGA